MKSHNTPLAFISHSSDVKEKFVIKFAEKLMNKGVDAWLDIWEIKPGDSIVNKIFEEGIKNCQAFIIILSKKSINSKWVRQELDVAIIKQIENQIKLIPVLIDDVEVPEALKAIAWVKIKDINKYDDSVKEIANSILGLSDKPEVVNSPKFDLELYTINDLSKIDSIILKILVEFVLKNDKYNRLLTPSEIIPLCAQYDISEKDIEESLEILRDEGYVDISLTNMGYLGSPLAVEDSSFIDYSKSYIPNFDYKVKEIISLIINKDIHNSEELAKKCVIHEIIVCSLLQEWIDFGYLKYSINFTYHIQFQEISVSGKRYFKGLLS